MFLELSKEDHMIDSQKTHTYMSASKFLVIEIYL